MRILWGFLVFGLFSRKSKVTSETKVTSVSGGFDVVEEAIQKGNYDQAFETLPQVFDLARNQLPADQLADRFFHYANVAFQVGRHRLALDFLAEAEQLYAGVEQFLDAGQCSSMLGRLLSGGVPEGSDLSVYRAAMAAAEPHLRRSVAHYQQVLDRGQLSSVPAEADETLGKFFDTLAHLAGAQPFLREDADQAARQVFEQMYAVAQRVNGDSAALQASALDSIGQTYLDSDPAKAVEFFRRAEPLWGPAPEQRAKCAYTLVNLAEALRAALVWGQAGVVARQALDLLRACEVQDPDQERMLRFTVAQSMLAAGEHQQAHEWFARTLGRYGVNSDDEAMEQCRALCDAIHNAQDLGELATAQRWVAEAIALAEAAADLPDGVLPGLRQLSASLGQ